MIRAQGLGCLLGEGLLCALTGASAAGDTIYTNQADWLAAVSALGDVRSLSLTPVAGVPVSGAAYADDEGTLWFPDNHGDMTVSADGWFGDVHSGRLDDPADHEPHENRFTFASPVAAFGATVRIGEDWLAEEESLLLSFDGGTTTHRLMVLDYMPGFFGWVGGTPGGELWIGSDSGVHFYRLSGVQYVVQVPAPGETHSVPAPSSALGGLALMGMLAVSRIRRGVRRRRPA
jgi:hypothetical protein